MPSELDQQRRPTDWRHWNKTRLYLDDDAYDEHADDGADEDEADAKSESHLSLHLSEWRLRFGPNGVLSSIVAE